jgi:hypothetical protein
MNKSNKINRKKFSNIRYKFFENLIDDLISNFPKDLLSYITKYYNDNNVKFHIPTRIDLHNIENWNESLAKDDIIKYKVPSKKEILEFVKYAFSSTIACSNWFRGIDKSGFIEIHGPVIVAFVPSKKILNCAFIAPQFLSTAELSTNKTYMDNVCSVCRELICKDVIDDMYEYSIYNNDYDFGESADNIFVKINNAIEYLVRSSNFANKEELVFNNGLIGFTRQSQYIFTFSPIFQDFSINIYDMMNYHSREWLDEHKIL